MYDFDRYPEHVLDEIAERELGRIVARFKVEKTPEGGAPDEIKQEWVGVSLPVRQLLLTEYAGSRVVANIASGESHTITGGIPVHGVDAIRTLRSYGRAEAATWWKENYYGGFGTLVFRAHEGTLTAGE